MSQFDLKSNLRRVSLITFALASIPASAQWQSFKWAEMQQGIVTVRKAAIRLPVELDGVRCTMQLDTGVGLSMLYRNALPSRYSRFLSAETLRVEEFSFGPEISTKIFQLKYEKKNSLRDCGPNGDRIVGTIGNDYFANGTLRLDLASGRYQFNRGPLHSSEGGRPKSVDIEIVKISELGTFPVVTLSIGNTERKMVFDTGSASFDLVIFLKKNWLNLVGLPSVTNVKPIYVVRWGQLVPCYRAPIGQSVSLGHITLGPDMSATYCDDPRDSYHEENYVFGLLGLSPFLQSTVSIDYVSEKIYVEAPRTFVPTAGP